MPLAEMRERGGSLSPPQFRVAPEREQRPGLKSNFRLADNPDTILECTNHFCDWRVVCPIKTRFPALQTLLAQHLSKRLLLEMAGSSHSRW